MLKEISRFCLRVALLVAAFSAPIIWLNLVNPEPRLSIEAEIARQRMAEAKKDSVLDDIQISIGE